MDLRPWLAAGAAALCAATFIASFPTVGERPTRAAEIAAYDRLDELAAGFATSHNSAGCHLTVRLQSAYAHSLVLDVATVPPC